MSWFSYRRLLWAGPTATVFAIIANLFLYGVSRLFGEQFLIPLNQNSTEPSTMPALMLIVAILISGIAATFFFAVLLRFSKNPVIVFVSVAVAALVLAIGGPYYLPNTPMHTKILLDGMSLIAFLFITGGILLMSHPKNKLP
jgi:fumarate reductase subunit C